MRKPLGVMACLLVLVWTGTAGLARNLDGTLGLIRWPASTQPALVKAGDSFTITVAVPVPLSDLQVTLIGGGERRQVLNFEDENCVQPVEGMVRMKVPVPRDMPEGLYTVSALVWADTRFVDTAERAVRVYREWPKRYTIAHLTDVHIGKQSAPYAAEVFHRTAQQVSRLGVDFAIITGDLTESAQPEQYRTFIRELDGFTVPTFVVPGNHDRGTDGSFGSKSPYEDYCGPATYSFDLGTHRYVALDTRWEDEFLVYAPYKAWLERELAKPDPTFGIVFSHRISPEEYPWFGEHLPEHNYKVFLYGHTHRDQMAWLPPKRLLLVNTSHEFVGTYNLLTVEGDHVVSIRHVGGQM